MSTPGLAAALAASWLTLCLLAAGQVAYSPASIAPAARIVATFTSCRPTAAEGTPTKTARSLVLAVRRSGPSGGGTFPPPPHLATVCRFMTVEGLEALRRAMVREREGGCGVKEKISRLPPFRSPDLPFSLTTAPPLSPVPSPSP